MLVNPDKLKEYSPNELVILRGLGFEDDVLAFATNNPVKMLYFAGTKCWIEDIENEYSEALRRAIRHIECGKYRGTEEYEKLIEVNNAYS